MIPRYLTLSFVAFLAYSLVAPLLKVAMETVPSTMAVFLSNAVMLGLLGGWLVVRGRSPRPYLRHPKTGLLVAWGIVLAVGLLAYYRALALGPVSIVVPVFGLFIAVSSIIGIVWLGESITPRTIGGIVFAVVAIVLMSV